MPQGRATTENPYYSKAEWKVGLGPEPTNTMPNRATKEELLSRPRNYKTPACSARLGELQA